MASKKIKKAQRERLAGGENSQSGEFGVFYSFIFVLYTHHSFFCMNGVRSTNQPKKMQGKVPKDWP